MLYSEASTSKWQEFIDLGPGNRQYRHSAIGDVWEWWHPRSGWGIGGIWIECDTPIPSVLSRLITMDEWHKRREDKRRAGQAAFDQWARHPWEEPPTDLWEE